MQLKALPPVEMALPEPTPADAIADQAHAVLAARRLYESLEAKVKAGRKAWDLENSALLEARDLAKDGMTQREAALKALAVTVFAKTGSKQPGKGTSIREVRRLLYDPEKALGWALEKRMFLLLDKPEFESFAKDNLKQVPFARVTTGPTATIATDLAAALAEVAP